MALAVLGALGAAVVIAALPGGRPGPAAPASPARQTPAPPQPSVLVESGPPLGAAPGLYRIPLGCSGGARRSGQCSTHDVNVIVAVLRPIRGSWRGSLESSSASCVAPPVPPLARGKVKACRR